MGDEDVMNWQRVVVIVVVLEAITAFAIYFKDALDLALYWAVEHISWQALAAIGAVLAAIIAFAVYVEDKKANTYRYLADLYYEILRIGLKYPDFLDPKRTQKYKEAWPSNPKMYIKYDIYARMCWAHAEDIYAVSFFFIFF